MTEFDGVVPALGQALSQRGYTVLTPIQQAILAPELRHADLLVSAQTGSGKTVAFGLAIEPTLLDGAPRFERATTPLALAVAPTRELALQVQRELEWLYAPTGATVASCVGGMDMRTERRTLDGGAHIVVGTPGRLRDHIERGSLDMGGLKVVILDEADEMLDLGFRDDLEYILDAAPAERRTLMFSATVPRTITGLAKRYQKDAVRVSTSEEQSQHVDIDYHAFTVAPNDRENGIINVLRYYEPKSALVFCGTRMTVNHMTSRFINRGFSVVALSGELSQNERTHALQAMRDGRARVCIATDVAARGIDLPNLDLVIHADIPKNRENLLHRSGRTGRAGRKGICALIVPHNARRQAERLLGNARVNATWAPSPSIDAIIQRDRERMLDDPALSEPLSGDEAAFAQELLARHGAEQIAAAFLRLHRAGHPAPEELLDASPAEEPKKRRDDFKQGVWFSLSVGHRESAEPRWLLPMLCRAGHITKNEIGAIRVQQTETHVELTPGCVERFLAAIGPTRKVEEGIVLTQLDSPPPEAPRDGGYAGPSGPRQRSYANKTPFGERRRSASRVKTEGPDAVPASDEPTMDGDASSERPYAGKKPYAKKKPYTGKTSYAPYRSEGNAIAEPTPSFERKPAETVTDDAPRERRETPYAGKKPYTDKKPYAGKKPFAPRRDGHTTPEPNPALAQRSEAGAGDTRWDGRDKPYAGKKPYAKKKPHTDRQPAGDARPGPNPVFARKAAALGDDAPRSTGWAKPKGKKPFKAKSTPKFAKSGGKEHGSDRQGAAPLKRKKPSQKID